ncbi:hypothetical protein [Streptomyces milbemycinicus]|uniref:UspA domain-containing protein n=1 Tax=Streptomyces milbemycinicus TaxID=476552 RepID=A0ABW8M004_9ACTN
MIRGTPGAVLCAVASGAEDLLLIGAARPARHMAPVHRRSVHRAVLANADCAVLIVAGPRLLRREARLLRRATRNEDVRLLAPRPQRGRP